MFSFIFAFVCSYLKKFIIYFFISAESHYSSVTILASPYKCIRDYEVWPHKSNANETIKANIKNA